MKISHLLKRESFEDIFTETLSSFLFHYYNQTHTAKWLTTSDNGTYQTWFCNPYLNAIFVKNAKPEVFAPIISEFSTHPNFIKNILNKFYVEFATSKTFREYFCSLKIGVAPPIAGSENLLIVGGNHKLRILNHKSNEVISVLKSGFSTEFFQREIDVRTRFSDLPTPELLEVNKDGMWIKERYIVGTPLNRVTDKQKYDMAVDDAFQKLDFFLDKTSEIKKVLPYAEALNTAIYHKAKGNQPLLSYGVDRVLALTDSILSHIGKISGTAESTLFAHSHGDFHPANILLDDRNKLWLIDWEYSKVRQYGYDSLVFLLKSRFPHGFAQRVRRALDDNINDRIKLSKALTDWGNKKKLYLLLFLLEEIDLHLDENSNPALKIATPSFIDFVNEVDELTRIFQ